MPDMNRTSYKTAFAWLVFSVVIVVLDLWTKDIATHSLTLYRPEALTSWLNMTLAHNYGAAFSFLSDAGGWQRWLFTGLASVVTLVLIVWLFRLTVREKLTAVGLGLIIGGAVVTDDYAYQIKAAYGKNAIAAVKKVNALLTQ